MVDIVRRGVWLYDELVGFLDSKANYSWFSFSGEYLANTQRPVLGLRFEENLLGNYGSNMVLNAWFSNLLPEGVLREWITSDHKTNSGREVDLLDRVGHDLPGAVRVLPADEFPLPELDDESALAHDAPRPTENVGWRFSLAGVGLKFSVLERNDRFTCTATGEGGDWILKLPDATYSHVPLNEYTMMGMAKAVGIDVPDIRLVHRDQVDGMQSDAWPSAEPWAYAVRRFDRSANRRRVHIEDMAQVRSVYPSQKYEGNFETIASLVYRQHDEDALKEFVRRLVFNVLISNGDAHLKNWSLIYRDRRVPTLSPAYDIVATEVYRPYGEPEDLGIKFAGNRRFESVRFSQFAKLATRLNSKSDLRAVAEETVAAVNAVWTRFADELGDVAGIRVAVDESLRNRTRTLEG